MNDIYFREECMPYRIKACVVEDADGDYTVFVNEYLSDEAMQRAVRHELAHIRNGDLRSEEHFSMIEMIRSIR